MNHYAYRVYRNQITNPIYGGTVTASDMDSAVSVVIARCKIDVIHEKESSGRTIHYFMLNNQKVGILVYANPENY